MIKITENLLALTQFNTSIKLTGRLGFTTFDLF